MTSTARPHQARDTSWHPPAVEYRYTSRSLPAPRSRPMPYVRRQAARSGPAETAPGDAIGQAAGDASSGQQDAAETHQDGSS